MPGPEDPLGILKTKTVAVNSDPLGILKKKAVTENSLNGLGIPISISESNLLGDLLNPVSQFTETITTPNGASFSIDQSKIPAPSNTPDFVAQVQQRINDNVILPQDEQAIAFASGKKPEAVSAYLRGDNQTGWGIDRMQDIEQNKAKLESVIDNYNKNFTDSATDIGNFGGSLTAKFGRAYDAKDILSSPDKTSKFLQDYINAIQQTNNSKKKIEHGVSVGGNPKEDITALNDLYTRLTSSFSENKESIVNHIFKESAKQSLSNGGSKEDLINNTARLTDPIGYNNIEKALSIINKNSIPNSNPLLNHPSGDPFRDISATSDKEILNSQKGYAELKLNEIFTELANDKLAEGYLTNDPLIISQSKEIMERVDTDAIYRYPSVLKSQMADEVARIIASKGGNLVGTEMESADNHYRHFGSEQVEQIVGELGWLNDSKRKDAANWLIDNPGEIKDASVFGGLRNAITDPIKNLGLGILDVVGIRDKVDVMVDKTKEELFPQEFNEPELKPSFTIGGHNVYGRKTVNTIGNLVGMTAMAMATGGLARSFNAGLSAAEVTELASEGINIARQGELLSKSISTGERLSSYASFAIPSIDPNLKDSYNNPNITNDGERALYVTMGAILNGEGGRFLNLGAISKVPEVSETFIKIAKGLNEKTITYEAVNELLNKGKSGWLKAVEKYGNPILTGTKETLKGAATMAYFGAVDKINRMAFGDPNAKIEDLLPEAGKSFVDGIFAMIPFGFVKSATSTKSPNSSMKRFINDAARFPDSVADIWKISEMSESDRNSKMQILNTAVTAKNSIAATEAELGIELQQNQREVLVANKTVEAVLRDKVTRTTDENKRNEIITQADQLRDQSSQILQGLQFTETLEPKTELFEAEKEYNNAVSEGDLPKIEAAKIKLDEESDKANITPAEKTANIISVNNVIDKDVTYKGQDGTIAVDGKTVIFKVKGQEKEYEIGNVDEIGNASIKDYGIEQNNSVVSANETGNIVVREKEYVNNYSDPLAAINRNSDGEIISVNLETADGKKVTFRNNIAEDVAYQIHLKEITKDNGTKQSFEDFINGDAETANKINNRGNEEVAKEAAVGNNEEISNVNNQESAARLVEPLLGKGVLMGVEKAEDALKLIAEQAQNVSNGKDTSIASDGTPMDGRSSTERLLGDNGKEIVAAAIAIHPKESLLQKEDAPLVGKEEVAGDDDVKFTAKGGNKVVDEKGNPLVVYRSTYRENNFNDGVNYFAEDANYSKEIAAIMNKDGKASDYVETKPIKTIPVNISAKRVYELPQGVEMNGNVIKGLIKRDPDFTKKYDAVKGIDLYSDNKIVYAVFDKANIKEIGAEQSKPNKSSSNSKEAIPDVTPTPKPDAPLVGKEEAGDGVNLGNSQKDVNLQNGKAEQSTGIGQVKGNSEKAQYNGTDAIGQRNRTESDKAVSREAAKEKVKNPATNASLQAANDYNKSAGLPEVQSHEFKPSDKVVQSQIGEAYQQLQDVTSPSYKETELERQIFDSYKSKYPELFEKHVIKNYKDLVEKSYAELVKETDAQFNALPIKVDFHEGESNYKNSAEMLDDVHNFGHLWVFKGGEDHTLLGSKTMDKNGLTANDKFRAVHDYFGHSVEGYQFGKDGEENAWIEHSKMFSPLAQMALSSETRGQNSFVNFFGINDVAIEKMKLAAALNKKGLAENNQQMISDGNKLLAEANNEFQFAEQKSIILPEKYSDAKKYFKPETQQLRKEEVVGNKNGLKFDKDNKDKFYVTKDGKYRVFYQDLEMVVRDKETNEKVSKAVEKRVLREYAENFDFSHGKEATEVPDDIGDNVASLKHIINTSENPYQVAEIYVNEEPQTQSLSDKEVMIADYGIQIHQDSFNRFADRNLLTPGIKKAYIVSDKNINTPAKRSLLGIDTQAQEISNHYGVEITPSDIVNFIERFPGGVKDALKLTDSEVSVTAQERFKELTGLKLNHELAEKVINQKFELLTKKEQELAQKDYETEKQLTDEYWKAFKETDGFTKESTVSETKQTETTNKVNGEDSTNPANKPLQENAGAAKEQGNKEAVPEGTNGTKQPDAEATPPVPPVKPPLTTEVKLNPENPETVLSFEGLQEIADQFGLDNITARERKTDETLMQDAKNEISKWVADKTYPEKIELLVKSALNSEVLTDQNRIILQQHIANVRNSAAEAKAEFGINSKEYDKSILELKILNRAGNLTRSAAGAALRISDVASLVRYDVADMMAAKMESLNVETLTEKQKEDIDIESKKIEFLDKNAEEKNAVYESAIAAYKAEIELLKQEKEIKAAKNTPAKRKENKTENDFKAERQSLKEKLQKQFQQYKEAGNKLGIISDGGGESFVISVKMAKTIGEIAKSHVEEIGANLKEVVSRVFAEIKDVFPAITERDIHDVIAGKYKEPQKTKSQLQIDLRDIKDEASLINKLESLERGEEPVGDKNKIERNQTIKNLRDKINLLRKGEPLPAEFKKLQEIKKRNETKEREIRDKINNGDFEKQPQSNFLDDQLLNKKFPKQYKEAMDAVIARENAKHDFEVGLLQDLRSKRSIGKKFLFDPVKDIIGTAKALKAGIDFSAIFIQNAVPIMSNPISGAKSVVHSFKDLFSSKRFQRNLASLHESAAWPLIQKSGLDVTEPQSFEAKNKEEIFNRNLLEKDITIGGKKFNIGKYITAPFERQFTSLGNHIRVINFLTYSQKLEADGHTFESNPKIFKDLATLLNTQTGRGKLPEFIQRSTETVNTIFWSPRLMASRLNLLGLGDIANPIFAGKKGFYASLDPVIRKKAAKEMASFIATVISVYATAAYFLGAKADTDPRSSTFGDLKDSETGKSYNMFGGFTQYVKLAAILATGERHLGNKKDDISDNKGKSRLDLGVKFLRGKVTPFAGFAINMLDKKDYMGKKVDVKNEALGLITPLSLSGVADNLKRDGLVPAFINGLIGTTGISVKDGRDYKKK